MSLPLGLTKVFPSCNAGDVVSHTVQLLCCCPLMLPHVHSYLLSPWWYKRQEGTLEVGLGVQKRPTGLPCHPNMQFVEKKGFEEQHSLVMWGMKRWDDIIIPSIFACDLITTISMLGVEL